MSATSRWPDRANSSATRNRCDPACPEPNSRIPAAAPREAVELVVVLAGLQRDVIAEPFRLLMRVGMTPDPDKQRGVIHVRSPLLVEPDPLGEPQRDQALPQHVLHRLPEAEIHAERKRGDELRQPDVRTIGPHGHSEPETIRPAPRQR